MRKLVIIFLSLAATAVPVAAQSMQVETLQKRPMLDDRKLQSVPELLRERMRRSANGLTHPAFRQRGCTFYEHANFRGKSKKFTVRTPLDIGQNTPVTAYRQTICYIGDDMNDRISSIRCDDKCGGWAAIHANMGGQMVPFVDPLPDLSRVADGRYNDQLSSLELICW